MLSFFDFIYFFGPIFFGDFLSCDLLSIFFQHIFWRLFNLTYFFSFDFFI